MLKKFLAAQVAALAVLSSSPASAHRVEPIRFELAPSGTGAQTTMLVTNTRSSPITIEAVPQKLDINEQGAETLTSAEDDFLIFPPQAIIEPGKAQAFRIRYIGNPSLDRAHAYRIGMNQLPVDTRKEGESGMSVLVNFATLANIVPPGAKAELSVSDVSAAPEGRWQLTVRNAGSNYARLSSSVVDLQSGDKRRQYTSDDTRGWFSHNLVLPGNSLVVTIPAPEGFDPASTTIRLTAGQ